jgi:hypothetical protein
VRVTSRRDHRITGRIRTTSTCFIWPRDGSTAPATLTQAQFNALVLGLPWQRLEQMAVVTHV